MGGRYLLMNKIQFDLVGWIVFVGTFGIACSSGLPNSSSSGGSTSDNTTTVGGAHTGGMTAMGGIAGGTSGSIGGAGGSISSGGHSGTAGSSSNGGATATGGSTSNGGTMAAGGTVATGGAVSTGGALATGGTSSVAGSSNTGGTLGLGGSSTTVLTGCAAVTGTPYFCDDFESGLSKWLVATSGWDTVNTTYQSPTHSVTSSPNGNYPQGADTAITMATSVDLTSAVSPVLVYWQKLDLTEANVANCYNVTAGVNCQAVSSDHVYIEVSTDGGTTWSQFKDMYCANNTSTWALQQLSLSAYIGKKIKLRFRLWDHNTDNCQGQGWYVDDVVIQEPN